MIFLFQAQAFKGVPVEGSKKCQKPIFQKKKSSPKGLFVCRADITPHRQHQFFRLLLSEGRCRDPGRSGWVYGDKTLLSVVRGCRGVDFRGWLVL